MVGSEESEGRRGWNGARWKSQAGKVARLEKRRLEKSQISREGGEKGKEGARGKSVI